jgi:hypothetical protein
MMRVPTGFTIFGYPGLAIIGYLLASVAAFYLIGSTLANDRRDQEKAKVKSK